MGNFATVFTASILMFGLLAGSNPVYAQTSAAEMLEEARARAREIDELKKVLNGPDQNMRLASFDVMVNSGDEAMRSIALEAGLASADSLLQSMALKEAVLSLDQLVMTVEIDGSQPESIQQNAQKYLDANGNTYTIQMPKKDLKAGTFMQNNGRKGEVSGSMVSFTYGNNTGVLTLQDDATLKGEVTIYQSGNGKFIATARLR